MSKISEARQALRDYARGTQIITHTDVAHAKEPLGQMVLLLKRGELAGKAFTAAQAALTVAEELRAEADAVPTDMVWDADTMTPRLKREAADRIEAAIVKALGQ